MVRLVVAHRGFPFGGDVGNNVVLVAGKMVVLRVPAVVVFAGIVLVVVVGGGVTLFDGFIRERMAVVRVLFGAFVPGAQRARVPEMRMVQGLVIKMLFVLIVLIVPMVTSVMTGVMVLLGLAVVLGMRQKSRRRGLDGFRRLVIIMNIVMLAHFIRRAGRFGKRGRRGE